MTDLDPKYRVKSVEKAAMTLWTLEHEAGNDGMSLTALATRISMSKSSMFSLLQTLSAYGLVASGAPGTPTRYRLGLGLIRLGQHAARQTTLGDVCRPELQALSAETGLTARAAVLDAGWAIPVARVDSPDTVRLDLRLGSREWPHSSGLGKALMSALPEAEVRSYLQQFGMPTHTPYTIQDVDTLMSRLAEARERGYAVDDQEDAEGIVCIASPVLDEESGPVAAISVTGLKAGRLLEEPESIAERVRTHAARLSELLRPARSS